MAKKKNKTKGIDLVEVQNDGLDVPETNKKKKGLLSGNKGEATPTEYTAASRLSVSKGKHRKRNTQLDRQRIALQEMIPVKDVWNCMMVDGYGQLYPVLTIGSKNTDLMSLRDLLGFQKQMEQAFSGLPVVSYQILIVPMPFDTGAWIDNNNKIRERHKKRFYATEEEKPLLGESIEDFNTRIRRIQENINWQERYLNEEEEYVKARVNSGQITTKRSFMILNLSYEQNKDMREALSVARTVVNSFGGSQLDIREATEQEARNLLYVLLNPLTDDILNVPKSLVEPTFSDEPIKLDIVLNEQFEKDSKTHTFSSETIEQAEELLKDRKNNRLAFDGKSQLEYPDLYPNATPENVPTQSDVERMEKEKEEEQRMYERLHGTSEARAKNKAVLEAEAQRRKELEELEKQKELEIERKAIEEQKAEAERVRLELEAKELEQRRLDAEKAEAVRLEMEKVERELEEKRTREELDRQEMLRQREIERVQRETLEREKQEKELAEISNETMSLEELQNSLHKALDNSDYEEAARISTLINEFRGGN